tara:strand:- start:2954 stop:4030 length:1077 start_codon:yes stop_codon:yes gene_type:complete
MNIFNTRLNKVRENYSIDGLDGIYITNITNVRYITGFTGSAGSVLIMHDKAYFITDGRYTEQSQRQIKNCEILITQKTHIDCIYSNNLIPSNAKIGIEANHISLNLFNVLSKQFNSVDWVQTKDIVEHIAAVKDMGEIESLKTAIEITDNVFDLIIPDLKAGAKEIEISAKISYLFKMNGAEGDSYEPIVASGYLGALPHARPSDKAFEIGDFVVMDFGALYNGYHADMTRTILIGKPTQKHTEIYNAVLESQLAGISSARAGVPACDVDSACRNVISGYGYGEKFIHSTGHGIGLEVHTLPRISQLNKEPLLENYVVTIEPGIYLEGWGGVRIEDDCWIQKGSAIPLNRSSKELISL